MRVFVAGASGVVGRPLCRQLAAAGHQVAALTRSPAGAAAVAALGAQPVVADVFDEPAMVAAMAAARPDAVVHQLTAIPPRLHPRRAVAELAPTGRLRTEGTRILLAAARAAGARRFVAQSISFAIPPEGESPAGEEAVWDDPAMAGVTAPVASLEAQVTGATDLVGIALRYGSFYGPGTFYAPGGSVHADVLRRRMPIVGRGEGTFAFVHVDDAAAAAVCALERGERGIYNVADDEPAPVADWLPHYAELIGARPPMRVPRWVARLIAGRYAIFLLCRQRAISSRKAREQLGWRPARPTWRGQLADG